MRRTRSEQNTVPNTARFVRPKCGSHQHIYFIMCRKYLQGLYKLRNCRWIANSEHSIDTMCLLLDFGVKVWLYMNKMYDLFSYHSWTLSFYCLRNSIVELYNCTWVYGFKEFRKSVTYIMKLRKEIGNCQNDNNPIKKQTTVKGYQWVFNAKIQSKNLLTK